MHREHLKLAKGYDFAYVRHHTHCESPEFYDAADESGIMIQPGLPYYGNLVTEAFSFDPKRELTELIIHYRRHVSLSTYCMGNEGNLGSPLDHEPLPAGQAARSDAAGDPPGRRQEHGGQLRLWQRAGHPDWGEYPQESDPRPWIHHEYLNLAIGRDPQTVPKYTEAYLPGMSLEGFRQNLESLGLDPKWGFACLDAGHRFSGFTRSKVWNAARLNPRCNGYIYWTIVSVDGCVDQGLLSPFWEIKASKPDFFRLFNSPTTMLAKMSPADRILTDGETMKIEWWISHFARNAIRDGKLVVRLVASPEFPGHDCPSRQDSPCFGRNR